MRACNWLKNNMLIGKLHAVMLDYESLRVIHAYLRYGIQGTNFSSSYTKTRNSWNYLWTFTNFIFRSTISLFPTVTQSNMMYVSLKEDHFFLNYANEITPCTLLLNTIWEWKLFDFLISLSLNWFFKYVETVNESNPNVSKVC